MVTERKRNRVSKVSVGTYKFSKNFSSSESQKLSRRDPSKNFSESFKSSNGSSKVMNVSSKAVYFSSPDLSHVKPLLFKVSLRNNVAEKIDYCSQENGYVVKMDKEFLYVFTRVGLVKFHTLTGKYHQGPDYSLSKSSFSAVRGFCGTSYFDNNFLNKYSEGTSRSYNLIQTLIKSGEYEVCDCSISSDIAVKYKSFYYKFSTELRYCPIIIPNSPGDSATFGV